MATKSVYQQILPYHYYTFPVFSLIILGLADTAYLTWSHYKNYTDLTFSSFCALSKTINCDTVSQSPWSIFIGLPLAVWGVFAYSLLLMLFLATLTNRNHSRSIWYILFVLALLYASAAIYFGYIAITKIQSYCFLCLASYAINFSLLFYSWIIARRFCVDSFIVGLGNGLRQIFSSTLLKVGIPLLFLSFIGLYFFISPYWQYPLLFSPAKIRHGLTVEGHPWIGAENAKTTIHEYTDYQCFQCGKMHLLLRQLIAEHPNKIKLIHHHYPMDHEFNNIIFPEPFHIGSGKMAMIAIYAASKNKFWEMNDTLYALGRQKEPFNTKALADMTGFSSGELAAATRHSQIREALLYDIRQGMKLEIVGTPTFVIDGKVYPGVLPADILKQITQ